MNIKCNVINETNFKISKKLACDCAIETIKRNAKGENYAVSIVFVSAKHSRILNKVYYNKDSASDVLSFEYKDDSVGKTRYLGEIIITPALIKKTFKITTAFHREICHMISHGALHLLGFNHENSEKAHARMHKLEKKIINLIFRE